PDLHENDAVAGIHQPRLLTIGLNAGCADELVVLASLVSGLQGLGTSGSLIGGFTQSDQIIGALDPVPAVVPVHGEITTHDGCSTTHADFGENGVGFLQRRLGATGRCVATIQEGMQEDALGAARGCDTNGLKQMLFMAGNAAGGEQSEGTGGRGVADRLGDGLGSARARSTGTV